MSWKHNTETNPRGYAFVYDNLSRLTKAGYLINGTVQTYNATTPIYQTAYSYDKHGNMKTLQRYGNIDAAKYGLIDNLTMTYAGNQMTRVDEAAAAISIAESMDFKNGSNVANEYTYNANGAMNKDLNKGITEIQYNSLNLPRQMIINSSSVKAKNYYTYSASGVKLRTEQRYDPNYTVTPSNATNPTNDGLADYKNTDYAGNIIYETVKSGSTITNKTRILVSGGYIEGGLYYYYLTDHLGNNRVVANASGTVIQRNHYYPFGMSFADTPLAEQGKQPYKYNGKELDQMHQLNLYDYSARFYEPAIGRFSTVDPHAEKYYNVSPYAYVSNNPMSFIDPNGMDSIYYQSRYIPTPGKKNIMHSFKISYGLVARVGKGGQNVYSVTFSDVVVTPLGGIYTNGGVLTDYHGNVIGEEGLEIVSPEFEALMIGRGLASMIGGKVVSSMAEKTVAKEATNSLRQVGKLLESVEDVFANPNLLKGQSPTQIEGLLGKTSGWEIETLGRGSHKGQGMILREYGKKGPTGRMIQWHPGGGHHGSKPYWKVSSGVGTHRIF